MRALAFLLLMAVPAWAQPPVPAEAIGFVHVRAADLWTHDMFRSLREVVQAAGPKALAAFDEQMYPNPADLDTVTLVVLPKANPGTSPPMDVVALFAFKTDLNAEKVRKVYLPEAATSDLGGRKFYIDKDKDIGLHFPDAKHLLAGPAKAIEAFLALKPAANGPLSLALMAAKTKAVTIAVNVKALPIPPQAYEQIPPDLRPLAMVQQALFTIDLGAADPVMELKAGYGTDAAAGDAEKALKAAIAMGKQAMKQPKAEFEGKLYANAGKGPQPIDKAMEAGAAMLAIGAINRAEIELDRLPIKRSGTDMTASVTIPKEFATMSGAYTGAMMGLLLPAVQKVRGAASTSQSQNNMKQMGLAFFNIESETGQFPAAAICNKDGKPLLSWRVAILPYLEQGNLYSQFKLDEPWDSANNKPLIEKMPKTFLDPRIETKPGLTVYKVFVGPGAVFDWNKPRKIATITDGISNTIMAIEGGDPVIWTKPEEIEFDPAKKLPKLDLPGGVKLINILMADGSVRRLDLNAVSEKTLKIMIGAADGEVIPADGDLEPAPQFRKAEAVAPAPPVKK